MVVQYSASNYIIEPQHKCYLKNNDMLDQDIVDEIRKAKMQPLTELELLERDSQALNIVLSSMIKKIEDLKVHLAEYDVMLSPVRTLTDDVLEEIFCHCLPTTRNARPFTSEAPMVLTLVCKKWRSIAMSAPRLWTTLHIPFFFEYQPSSVSRSNDESYNPHTIRPRRLSDEVLLGLWKDRNQGLCQWLQRSGTLPISLSLCDPSWHATPPSFRLGYMRMRQEVITLVAEFAHRISSMDAVVTDNGLVQLGMAAMDAGRFPPLRSLRITTNSNNILDTDDDILAEYEPQRLEHIAVFFPEGTLQELSVCALQPGYELIFGMLPSSLTVITWCSALQVNSILHVLRQCPRLQRCHFNARDKTYNPVFLEPISADIRLPFLETFSLNGSLPLFSSLCGHLETPSLLNLRLGNEEGELYPTYAEIDLPYPPPSTDVLCRFLLQCTSLKSLTINPISILDAELQAVFAAVPQITELVLTNQLTFSPGECITRIKYVRYHHTLTVSALEYHLYPLLKQQRMSKATGLPVLIEETLLPHLTSFSWHQFSILTPNELLLQFLKDRLHNHNDDTNTGCGINTTTTSQPSTALLRDIEVALFSQPDDFDFDVEINRHAQRMGLRCGQDFRFQSFVYPWAKQYTTPTPNYTLQKDSDSIDTTYDDLCLKEDVTWPYFDI